MKTTCAALLSIAVLAATALPAAADPVMYGNDVLSAKPGELGGYPVDLLVDDRGVATLVYVQQTGPSGGSVMARRRPPGGVYGPPITVGGQQAPSADAAIAGDGSITVVWDENSGASGIHARTIRPDGSLGPDATVGTGGSPHEPRVAVGETGAKLIVWRRIGDPAQLVAVGRDPGDSFFGGQVTVSSAAAGESAHQPVPLVGADQSAYITYVQDAPGTQKVLVRKFDVVGNSPDGPAQPVSAAAAGKIATDAAGAIDPVSRRLVFAWSEQVSAGAGNQYVIKSRSARADLAEFSAAQKISNADPTVANLDADEPEVQASPTGFIAVGWRQDNATDNEASAPVAVRPPGGGFSAPFDVVASDSTSSAGPAVPRWDGAGRLFVGFRQRRPADGISRAAVRTRRADGTWGPTAVVAPNRTDGNFTGTALAVPDPSGNVLITWEQRLPPDNTFAVVAAYGDDDGAPEVDPIAPNPAAALVSAPLQLSTVVRDFSTTTTAWSFGDGSPNGQGLSVAHAYAQPGDYDVKVTATDATGQAASRTTRAGISARPVVGPPRANRRPDSNITLRRKRMRRRAFKRVRGTASDDTRVARVQVAVVRVRGTKRRPKCAVMRRNASFKRVKAVKRTCRPRFWQTAKGTTSWSLKLKKRLGRGRYVVFSRAIDDQGARERSFSKRDGNRRALRLRR